MGEACAPGGGAGGSGSDGGVEGGGGRAGDEGGATGGNADASAHTQNSTAVATEMPNGFMVANS